MCACIYTAKSELKVLSTVLDSSCIVSLVRESEIVFSLDDMPIVGASARVSFVFLFRDAFGG